MFEDGSAALWLALNPKNYSGPTEISRFQQGRLVNIIGSKHPLPGGVILKEVRGIARDQEGGIWLFDLNQGLFRLAEVSCKRCVLLSLSCRPRFESANSPFLYFERYRQLRMVTTDGGCRKGHFVFARRGLNPAVICKEVR